MVGAIRDSRLPGRFYPADPRRLGETLDRLLETARLDAQATTPAASVAASPAAGAPRSSAMLGAPAEGPTGTPDGEVMALVVPHAALRYSGATAARAYARLGRPPRRALLLGPAHFVTLGGVCVAPYDGYRTPLGTVPVDCAVRDALAAAGPPFSADAAPHEPEHALEVHLPFLQRCAAGCAVVPLLCGRLRAEDLQLAAAALAPYWDGETIAIASSDFTHFGPAFGFVPFAPTPASEARERLASLDHQAIACLLQGDPKAFLAAVCASGATICGRQAIALLLSLAQVARPGLQWELLDYRQSAEADGDYTHSVSYAALAGTWPPDGRPRAMAEGTGTAA